MKGQLIDVKYENGCVDIVKIVECTGEDYSVVSLLKTSDGMYRFSQIAHWVPKESVAGFYDTTELEMTDMYTKKPEYGEDCYEQTDLSDREYETESESESESESDTDTETEI
jgi:hypothetical protein